MKRFMAMLAVLVGLSACSGEYKDLGEVPQPMGRFLLGHNVVVADDPEVGPLSRPATDEEWEASLTDAIAERFGRYDGDQYFHIAVKVEGFVLALPGVPLVASPKSTLVVAVTVWDDASGTKLNEEPKRIIAFERGTPATFLSSGLTQSKQQQMLNLSRNAAKKIHEWMLENPEWFGDASLMDPATTSPGQPALPRNPDGTYPRGGETAEETGTDETTVAESG